MLLCGLLANGISQADSGDAIRQCASLHDKDARIACLEDALRRADGAADPMPQAADVVPPPPEPRPAPQAVRADPGQEAETAPASENTAGAGASRSDSLGAEQVTDDRRGDEDNRLEAAVVAFDFVRYQRLRVQLDNGQVWRQVDGDRADVSRELDADSKFDVELWKTGLGGYRMRIVALDRTLRVQRLK